MSHTITPRLVLAALACASLVGGARAEFDTLERGGGLSVYGNIVYQDYDYSRSKFISDGVSIFNAGLDPLHLELSLSGLKLSEANFSASGSTSASLQSTFNGVTLGFIGAAQASMVGNPLIGALMGNDEAAASFSSSFNVALPMQAALSIEHTASINSSYRFSITRQDGFIVWDRVTLETPSGPLSSFTTTLDFQPGTYALLTTIRAIAGIDLSGIEESASISAAFTLTPVPEPTSGMLLLVGLAPVVWRFLRYGPGPMQPWIGKYRSH